MFRISDTTAALLEELGAVDRQLGDARRDSVARAVTAGAETARTDHRFQSRTGATVGGIQGEVLASTQSETVGVLESNSEVSVILNDGTRPHAIVPRTAKALRFETDGKVVFAAHAQHPGTDPDPFFDRGVDRAEAVFLDELDAALNRVFGD